MQWFPARLTNDAHLNDPADFFGAKTNKMFILTQVANHDALHYGNLVAYLRFNSLVPSGGWFGSPCFARGGVLFAAECLHGVYFGSLARGQPGGEQDHSKEESW
jgi:hypothetical protein